ncbi:hypothetical protein K8O68_11050 [Salipaludibacillus sp. CUR1]|uniref:hypothetical protein n=1 Tax=Salipaludibacillus sp. CUR1 TaxID=2820003 RepID=UPI001E3B3426|nr:hypothetical protein [Salipaludibacillus sp. CUR1]MCE7792953.1 hypothetical protein [Salipaludibacillus sp. CUR1]
MKLPSIREADNHELGKVVIVTSVLMIISAFILPIVFVMLLQDIFFFSRSHWIFSTPASAYIIFGAGMLWVPLVLIAFLSIKVWVEKREKTIRFVWVYGLSLMLCLPLFALGVSNYYYMDDQGIYYNDLASFSESGFLWDDITTVKRTYTSPDNSSVAAVEAYTFITKTGEEVEIPYHSRDTELRQIVNRVINEYNFEVID